MLKWMLLRPASYNNSRNIIEILTMRVVRKEMRAMKMKREPEEVVLRTLDVLNNDLKCTFMSHVIDI